MAADQPRTRKFAICGRRGSGKSCILAALAMPRIAHIEQFTCTWIPELPGVPRPKDRVLDSNDWVGSFYRGTDWLQDAIECLEEHRLPENSPLEVMRFRYQFTTPDKRSYDVELIDYSGELLQVELTHAKMAGRLRELMVEMDAIFVLVETPRPNGDPVPLSGELSKLQQAFVNLKEERLGKGKRAEFEIPISLLVNKWDRQRTPPLGYSAELERAELEKFINGTPNSPYRAFADVLENSVSDPQNFCAFPLSAFGEHETIEVVVDNRKELAERPKQVKPVLKSFALEDPFIWAAQRCDEMDVQKFEAKAGSARTRHTEIMDKNRELQKRLPKESEDAQRVRAAMDDYRSRRRRSAFRWTLVAAVVVMLSLGFWEKWVDQKKWNAMRLIVQSQDASAVELKACEKWLGDYRTAVYRHWLSRLLVLSQSKAADTYREVQDRREELLFTPIEDAWTAIKEKREDDASKPVDEKSDEDLHRIAQLAAIYLEEIPGGNRTSKVQSIQAEANRNILQRENEVHLRKIEDRLAAELPLLDADVSKMPTELMLPTESQFEELSKAASVALPQYQVATIGQIERHRKVTDRIHQSKALLSKYRRWRDGRENYEQLLGDGKVCEAAKVLVDDLSWAPEAWRTEINSDFESRWLSTVRQHVEEQTNSSLWKDASDYIQEMRESAALALLVSDERVEPLEAMLAEVRQNEFEEEYAQAMADGKVQLAGSELVDARSWAPEEVLNELDQDFQRRCMRIVEEQVVTMTREDLWKEARDFLWEVNESDAVAALLPADQLQLLKTKISDVDQGWRKHRWRSTQKEYARLMVDGKVREAATALTDAGAWAQDEGLSELNEDFQQTCLRTVGEQVDDMTDQSLWQDARDYLRGARDSRDVNALLTPDQIAQLEGMLEEVDRREVDYICEETRTRFDELMRDRKVLEAAKELVGACGQVPEGRLDDLTAEFQQRWLETVKGEIDDMTGESRWEDARDQIRGLKNSRDIGSLLTLERLAPLEGMLAEVDRKEVDYVCEETRRLYDQLMRDRKILEAAEKLVNALAQVPEERLENLKVDFQQRCVETVRVQVEESTKSRSWEDATKCIDDVRGSSDVTSLLPLEQREALDTMITEVRRRHDKVMYEEVLDFKDLAHARRYLEFAPIGSMKGSVQAYVDYLVKRDGPHDFHLTLASIDWGQNVYHTYDHEITVQLIQGYSIIHVSKVRCEKNERSWIRTTGVIKDKKSDDMIRLYVKAVRLPYYWGQGKVAAGQGAYEGKLDSLDGETVTLQGEDGRRCTATFALADSLQTPELPREWKAE